VLPRVMPASLPAALRDQLPHLPKDKAVALVCSGSACFPPATDPDRLRTLLSSSGLQAAAIQG